MDDCPTKLAQITAERDRLNDIIGQVKDPEIAHLNDLLKNLNAAIEDKNRVIAGLEADKKSLAEQLTVCQQTSDLHLEQANKVPELTRELEETKLSRDGYMANASALQAQLTKLKNSLVPKKYLSLKLYKLLMALE